MTAMTLPAKPWTNGMLTADQRYQYDSTVGAEGAWRANPVPVGGLPAGSIIQWASNTIPANWLLCDGSAVSRTVYPSLFAAIGTQYGSGDGSTTFNLPDLRGRVAVGKNGGTFGTLGATGGAETHLLTANEAGVGSHTHTIRSNDGGNGPFTINKATGGSMYYTFGSSGATNNANVVYNDTVSAPASAAHNNLQPYLVTNYIIKATAGWTAGDSELATRVGALETADATTNKSGLVPIIPTSVAVGSGSGSVSAAGLVSFTAANTVSLNGAFSSAYSSYRVIVRVDATNNSGNFNFRFRQNGSDMSGTNYEFAARYDAANGTGSQWNSASNTYGSLGAFVSTTNAVHAGTLDIFKPYEAAMTQMNWDMAGYMSATGSARFVGTTNFSNTTQVDGFTLFSNVSANLTGSIKVYGYR